MINQIISDKIHENFNAFMHEMHKWEENANQYIDEKKALPKEELREKLKNIYSKYLTDKERKKGRILNFTVQFPPEYTPSLEKITKIEIKGNNATVYTERIYAELTEPRIYKWKNINGCWKIDSAKQYDTYDDKWYPVYL